MGKEPPLASLSLTHVHYVSSSAASQHPVQTRNEKLIKGPYRLQNPEDHLSHLSAWLALVPQALCVVYVTLVWATREVEVGLMFAGQLACEALNFALKRIIKEERPKEMFGKGYGMPSSHAQFVAFFAVYMGLFLLFRHSPNAQSQGIIFRIIATFGISLGATAVAASRIYLTYHTLRQVLAGSAVGVVFALAWFIFTGFLRSYGWIDWGLDHSVARCFRLRDLVVSEDLAEAGWQRWEAKHKVKRSENGGRTSKLD